MQNYPLKTDGIKLTTELPKHTKGVFRPFTISDIEDPIIVVNGGFLFRVLYPSVLVSYVFTNMNKPKNWEDPQDDISYTEIASFTISLCTASCGIGVEPLYSENGFLRALYRFHVYYTERRFCVDLEYYYQLRQILIHGKQVMTALH